MIQDFWEVVEAQLAELRSARSADDVVRILSAERNPYGHDSIAGDGFFAGGGGDDRVEDALADAGWTVIWWEAWYHYAMRAPDGSAITYVEGDIYRGEPKAQRPSQSEPVAEANPVTADEVQNLNAALDVVENAPVAEPAELPSGRVSQDPDGLDCYSDHAHDILTRGACDFCGSTEPGVVGHVLPDVKRMTDVDPVKASAIVVRTGGAYMFDGVLLDLFSASAVQAVYAALRTESARAKLRSMSLVGAVTVCFKVINKSEGK